MNSDNPIFLSQIDPDHIKVMVVISVIILTMFFLHTFLKKILEYKLKSKILDKSTPEALASVILQKGDDKQTSIKWFLIFSGLGVGFFIVSYTLPFGVGSIGIMATSIAISFLLHYFYLKQFEK